MARALELAAAGQGRVEPNPMVGSVIIRDGRVLGEGYHQQFGGPHAEVLAIQACRDAGYDPAGSTMYVNLEPCCHHGKTPPCTRAIVEANITSVVAAMVDPNPQVAGAGIAALREAGVDVLVGVSGDEAGQLNLPFIKRQTTGLPWIIAKWAQTLDGKTATATGDSKWISNELSRHHVHELRARVDAVMVGVRTVMIDDPLLTARVPDIHRKARRVVVDPGLKIPPNSQLIRNPDPPVLIAHAVDQTDPARLEPVKRSGVETMAIRRLENGRLDLKQLLAHLAEVHAATNVLIEGGGRLIGTMLDQELVDQLLVFLAPKIIGDQDALTSVQGLQCDHIASALQFKLNSTQQIGDDLMLDYRFADNMYYR